MQFHSNFFVKGEAFHGLLHSHISHHKMYFKANTYVFQTVLHELGHALGKSCNQLSFKA